jgi:hypothetical protein
MHDLSEPSAGAVPGTACSDFRALVRLLPLCQGSYIMAAPAERTGINHEII